MIQKRQLLSVLLISLTVPLSVLAQMTPGFYSFKDSYQDREQLLKSSKNLCRDLSLKPKISGDEASRLLAKIFSNQPVSKESTYDSSGWTLDFSFQSSPLGFLRIIKSKSSFIFSYRQSESTIESIANFSWDASCERLSEGRLTYHNSSLRPIRRIKINSQFELVQSVIMEEPVQEFRKAKTPQEPIRIGIIDSGIDYNHPVLLEKSRPMLGIDLTNPARPHYDYINYIFNELRAEHFSHGTAVADIASRNVNALIVPVRTEKQVWLAGAAVEYLASKGVRLVNISQGTNKEADWLTFKKAAQKHPEMLFIVAAGNESQNLDQEPAYPSAFSLPNMLVVTSADSEGYLSKFSNYSKRFVHFAALGEKVSAALAGGGQWAVNGTSFAAPLVTNMAARLLESNPSLTVKQLKDLLIKKAQLPNELINKVEYGILSFDPLSM